MLYHTAASVLTGLLTAILAYVLYRKVAVSLWGYISGFLADLPFFLLAPLGVTNLYNLLLLSHTTGIFLLPLLTVLLDLVLMGLGYLKPLRPFRPFLPKSLKLALKAEKIVGRLQQYRAVPQPVRVARVYAIGVAAGMIHLGVNLFFGVL